MINHPALLTAEEIDLICEAHRLVDLPDDIATHIAKAQTAKVVRWGEGECTEHKQYGSSKVLYFFLKRYECPECRQSLQKVGHTKIASQR